MVPTSSTLPNGTYGAEYTQAITATGDGAPFTFVATGGKLPPGLNLNADGTWSGTFRHVLKVFLLDQRNHVRNVYSVGLLDPQLVLNDLRTLARAR